MPRVGRNDPCPCGSGKKYKNCCMRQDRLSVSRQLNTQEGEAFLLSRLYNYAQSPRFGGDLIEAFSVYWGGIYDLEGVREAISQDDMQRMMEWFTHDYHTSSDRRYVIDLFIETQTTGLPEEALEVLNAWARSAVGAFRVQEFPVGDTLHVYDLFRQDVLEVHSPALAHNAQKGDILAGRLFEMGGVRLLTSTAMLLPADYEPGLLEYVHNAYNNYRSDHYQATWDQFLREYGYILNAYMLSPKAEALRALIGPGTRFHDPAISRDKLRAYTNRSALERQREAQEAAQGGAGRLAEHRSSGGIVLPGAAPEEAAAGAGAKAGTKAGAKAVAKTEPEDKPERPKILIPGRDF